MNSLGSGINTFGRYKNVNPKNELGTLLIFTFNHFVFLKGLNLLHSTKCSVSTQLTCLQKIQYNKVSISTTRSMSIQGDTKVKTLFTLKTGNFANFMVFAVLESSDFWISCHFGFLLLLVPLCKFLQNQHWFVKLWFLPETLVRHNHKTLPSLKIAKSA